MANAAREKSHSLNCLLPLQVYKVLPAKLILMLMISKMTENMWIRNFIDFTSVINSAPNWLTPEIAGAFHPLTVTDI